jgi:hypothetical protein
MVRILILTVVLGLAASPASAQEAAVTVASPVFAKTISEAEIERGTQRYKGLSTARKRDLALRLLIEGAWYEGEAQERGIVVTREEAEQRVRERVAHEYASQAAFRRALKRRGLTMSDVIARIRVDALRTAIRDQIAEPAAKSVTPEQIEAYVRQNPQIEPERRKVRIIRAKSRKDAERAKSAIARGLTWRSAVKRYAVRGDGSGVQTWIDFPDPPRLDRAILNAPPNTTTRYGKTVFKVTRITPEHPTPLDVQRAQAWEVLATRAQKQALQQHDHAFRQKWRQYTTCAPTVQAPEHCGYPPMGG